MRYTRIDIEGLPGHYATAQRRDGMHNGPDFIELTIITPESRGGRRHRVNADSPEEIFDAAGDIQRSLDGYPGSNSEVQEYHLELLRLSNC